MFDVCRMLIKTLLDSRCSDLSEKLLEISEILQRLRLSVKRNKCEGEIRKYQSIDVKKYINQTAKKAFDCD